MAARSEPTSAAGARVLVIDQSGELGGAELQLLPVVRALGERCHVILLADGPFRELLQRNGVAVTVLADAAVSGVRRDKMGWSTLSAVWGLLRQIWKVARLARGFDLVYLNTQKALVVGALGRPLFRKPVLFHLHDIMSPDHFGGLHLRLVSFIVGHYVTRVVANSQASADAILGLAKISPNDVRVVLNGVPSEPFIALENTPKETLRQRFGLTTEAFWVGVFGRLASWKGQTTAVDALLDNPDMHLALVGSALFGEDKYEASLRQHVDTLGLAGRVHFLGFSNEVPALMKAMDVVAHTSTLPEPFGRVVVEGMLSHRPVIASAAGGVTELIENGVTGILIEPGNSAALSAALKKLATEPAYADDLAQAAFVMAKAKFDETVFVDGVLHQIDDMINPAALKSTTRPAV
jgi:glycosyltransferase involved in cell wall biosynthesis